MYWPVAKEISFKDVTIFSSVGHVVVQINFGRGHQDEHFCEIILNQEMLYEDILTAL